MKIKGKIGQSGLRYVTAYVKNKHVDAPIRFYVDIGAYHTVISDRDAERIGIDYTKLKKAPFEINGVGGTADGYMLPKCMLIFQFGHTILIEYLDYILVLKHKVNNEKERMNVQEIPSLLGCNVLKEYSIWFTEKGIILEK